MFDGSTPATPSLASALSAFGFVGAWETNVPAGRSVLDAGASGVMAGDASLAGKPLTLDAALARIHPEDRGWVFERIARVRETGGAFSADFRIVTEAGDVRWIRNRGHLARTEAGMHGYGAFFDVTDTRRNSTCCPGRRFSCCRRPTRWSRPPTRSSPRAWRSTGPGRRACAPSSTRSSSKWAGRWRGARMRESPRAQANFSSLIAAKSCTPPPTRLVV